MIIVLVLYYSRTGNTEKMAKAVAEGVEKVQGVKLKLKKHRIELQELIDSNAIIIGMPTYNHDINSSLKQIFKEIEDRRISLEDKIGATFGSYGWSGEAPAIILEMMEKRFNMKVLKPPLLSKYTPNKKKLEECRKLGKSIAETSIKSR